MANSYRDLKAWQLSMKLALQIHRQTNDFPKDVFVIQNAKVLATVKVPNGFSVTFESQETPDSIVAKYVADFAYWDIEANKRRVEDAKSSATAVNRLYRLKRKLAEACHGITIEEI